MNANSLVKVAILDDYQNAALTLADWSPLDGRASITVFNDHIAEPDALIERLKPFDIVCVMRERTPLPRAILEKLPALKVIASTGLANAAIDEDAAAALGIALLHTGYSSTPTIEFTWALISPWPEIFQEKISLCATADGNARWATNSQARHLACSGLAVSDRQ
jgi:phosphoglycerate dehydrogenase-like enzyme